MISVILPVYNGEKYLRRAISSILAQTFKDFELIIVDDGSTDGSLAICNEYAEKDARINVIHQKNQGVSAARKKGFEAMKGDYFTSYDPDDWMETDYLRMLWNSAAYNDADIVYCDYDMVYSDKTINVKFPLAALDKITYLKAQMTGGMWGVYWNKLIRTSIMKEHSIQPIVGLTIWDDFIVVNSCALYANKIVYCDKILYHYNQLNANSVTKAQNEKKYLDIIEIVRAFEKEVIKSGNFEPLSESLDKLKLISKSYLLRLPYRNFNKWRCLFPETNQKASFLAKNKEAKRLIKYVVREQDVIATLLDDYFVLKEKITRHCKMLFCFLKK